jgi:hypothetical protein
MLYADSFRVLIIILQCALLTIMIGQQLITAQFAYSSTNSTQHLRLNGPINSLQFSSEGDIQWIVSGRWRMDVNFDDAGIVPIAIRGFNTTLVVVPADGSSTERYELSDFKQDSISYDNKTKTSLVKGKLTITSKDPIENIGVDLKLINKNILTITLDPSKTRDQLGETPIYGVER